MTRRNNQIIAYLDDPEHQQLKEWSEETGKSMSELVRTAVSEYLDQDRDARVEQRLARIEEQLQALGSEPETHTHTESTSMFSGTAASETVEKTREIVTRLQQNHEQELLEQHIERAIKDIAGGDPRTVDKYKSELKDRCHCFEHPNPDSPIWYLEKKLWVNALRNYAEQSGDFDDTIRKLLKPYGVEKHEIEPLLQETATQQQKLGE